MVQFRCFTVFHPIFGSSHVPQIINWYLESVIPARYEGSNPSLSAMYWWGYGSDPILPPDVYGDDVDARFYIDSGAYIYYLLREGMDQQQYK